MARLLDTLAVLILSAALFGSVLGQAPSPAPTTTSVMAPSPPLVPSPESSYGPAPPPGPDCFTVLLNVSDCLTFVEPGSNLTVPDQPCCPELSSLVDNANFFCLCKMLGDPESIGLNVDTKRALQLPSLCAVSTPPPSLCSALGVPVSAPVGAEGPSPSGGIPPSSFTSAPTVPKSGASRSAISAAVFGMTIIVSMFF